MADIGERIHSERGLCTSVTETNEENARRIHVIMSTFLVEGALEVSQRTEDRWSVIYDLPMDFTSRKYRSCR